MIKGVTKASALVRPSAAHASLESAYPLGLGAAGVHEVVAAAYGDRGAAAAFALASVKQRTIRSLIWISETSLTLDNGALQERAARQLLGHQTSILHISTKRPSDALWALEEAVRTNAASLVIAALSDLNFTASRRLTLASGRFGTPVVLLLPHTHEGASTADARWRIAAGPSSQNKHDPRALGRTRWRVELQRSRKAPALAGHAIDLEFDDETLSLNMVPGLAARPPAALSALATGDGLRRAG